MYVLYFIKIALISPLPCEENFHYFTFMEIIERFDKIMSTSNKRLNVIM